MQLSEAPSWIWSLVLLCVFAAIGVLILTEINTNAGWNVNSTSATVIYNATEGIDNVIKQLPTVGIITGVMLILAAVVMIAMYFGRKDYI